MHDWIITLKTFGHIPIILIGTKNDLISPTESQVIDNYISEIKQEYDNVLTYIKISSKTGENIRNAFKFLIGNLIL